MGGVSVLLQRQQCCCSTCGYAVASKSNSRRSAVSISCCEWKVSAGFGTGPGECRLGGEGMTASSSTLSRINTGTPRDYVETSARGGHTLCLGRSKSASQGRAPNRRALTPEAKTTGKGAMPLGSQGQRRGRHREGRRRLSTTLRGSWCSSLEQDTSQPRANIAGGCEASMKGVLHTPAGHARGGGERFALGERTRPGFRCSGRRGEVWVRRTR